MTAGSSKAPAASAPRGFQILVVEDDHRMRRALELLIGAHWTVEAVGDAEAALRAARERLPDLVLADLVLPGADGVELMRQLHAEERTRDVPVIVITGVTEEAARRQALEGGACDFLVKPFAEQDLIERMTSQLQRAPGEERRRPRAAAGEGMPRARPARTDDAADRLKDEFLAVMSHELRTPLNSILGWAHLLRAGGLDDATVARGLEIIERNARTQNQIISDMLDVSRIVAGKLRLDVREVDMAEVIEAVLATARSAADAKGIALETALDPSAARVAGDPERLRQVVRTLLANALKFTPRGGRVLVRLGRAGSRVRVAIEDTGHGIAPEFLPHVFERFRQADSSSTRSHQGLGLGLALARHLVDLHGGTVEATSPGPGHGSTFTVELPPWSGTPAAASHPEEASDAEAAPGPDPQGATSALLHGVRVLVVDDEPGARELVSAVLQNRGANVVAAGSAKDGLAVLGREAPHVLLSDIEMPGEDGYSLIRKVRALPPEQGGNTPAAALTAYARAEDRSHALKAGFQEHLPKPVEPAELVSVVAGLAGRRPR